MYKTGHSLIKAKMKEEHAELAGEMSGHMFFGDRYRGYDDALYAACRLIEIVAKSGQPLSAQLAGVPKMVSTPEIRVDCPDEIKFELVAARRANISRSKYKTIDIDGVRVIFPEGWGLLRASNTQPVLVMRFEAANEHLLKQYQSEVEQVLEASRAAGAPAHDTPASRSLFATVLSRPASAHRSSCTPRACWMSKPAASSHPARCWSKATASPPPAPPVDHPAGAQIIDLGDTTLLPGLIDAHVHLFLHPGAEDLQTVQESVPQRTIIATLAARDDLMAGFTAERDMGTEGAGAADTAVRNAIDQGLIPGPRLRISGNAIDILGGHEDAIGYNPEQHVLSNAT